MPDHDFTSTCDLYDEYLDKARVPTLALRNFGSRRRFSGRATTVTCFEDNSRVKELAQTPGTGRVMVVDGGGSLRCALVGDVIAGMAVDNGWEGIVVHAAIRDSDALAKLDIGVMALGSTPRKSVRNDAGEINVDVELGEVFCRPDDRVFADADGILLLDP